MGGFGRITDPSMFGGQSRHGCAYGIMPAAGLLSVLGAFFPRSKVLDPRTGFLNPSD